LFLSAHLFCFSDNIFVDCHGDIFLNDWSSAAKIGSFVPWVGTRGYSVEDTPEHLPSAKSDLISFVKTAFSILLSLDPGDDYKQFWDDNMSLPFWKSLMEHAERCDYDKVKELVASL
jgi:hypothetical protein